MRGSVPTLRPEEEATARLYGDLWVEFDPDLYRHAMDLLLARFGANELDHAWFHDKRCLDAGCGGGRATLLMGTLGARLAVGLDIGSAGLRVGRRMGAAYRLKNVAFRRGSVLRMPFPDESFDFVLSNGVLHHTADPDRGLAEIFRVLKCGGHLWLYLYGAGGIHWMVVDAVRRLVKRVPPERARSLLKLYRCPANKRFILMDHWYVPILRRYTAARVEAWLRRRGFVAVRRLRGGVSYDTDEMAQGQEAMTGAIYGEGDLRYLAQRPTGARTARPGGAAPLVSVLPGRRPGVPGLGRALGELVRAVEGVGPGSAEAMRVLAAARLHLLTLDLLERRPFDLPGLRREVAELRRIALGCRHRPGPVPAWRKRR